jgi:hypothetical protein
LERRQHEQYQHRIYDENGKWHLCPHANVIHHIEPDGDIVICSDCGGWLDEDGKVYRYSPSLEETF